MATSTWACGVLLILSGVIAAVPACARVEGAHARPNDARTSGLYPDALTFAQVDEGTRIATILVRGANADTVQGIDLSRIAHHYARDAFDVVNGLSWGEVERIAREGRGIRSFPASRLVGVGPRGANQIAAGTNYPEHGKETGMADGAFLFPKFSEATGPSGEVATGDGVLLDYEAEVCARFDREIRTLADFDAARKGFFLCGDFSDRATLFRGIDLADPYSGDGFPDAKSGPGRFPTGALLVVPSDWKTFLATLRFGTHVNGEQRQDVAAADMLKDLRTIVAETLEEAATRTWSYRSARVPMVRRAAIGTEAAVLTGTGDGVVFREPGPGLVKALMDADGRQAQLAIIAAYVQQEAAARKYLQAGDRVVYGSNYLGRIETRVVDADRTPDAQGGAGGRPGAPASL